MFSNEQNKLGIIIKISHRSIVRVLDHSLMSGEHIREEVGDVGFCSVIVEGWVESNGIEFQLLLGKQ